METMSMSIIWQSYCKSKHSENRFPFHLLPSHLGLRNYVLYYNIVFPDGYLFPEQYTLMPNACGTLSLAFDGTDVTAELWGASLMRPQPQKGPPYMFIVSFFHQVISSLSASMIFSFFILLTAYIIVAKITRSTLNTLIPILVHGITNLISSAPPAAIPL